MSVLLLELFCSTWVLLAWSVAALGITLAILGGVFLVTGLIGFCPLYAMFKFSSRKA